MYQRNGVTKLSINCWVQYGAHYCNKFWIILYITHKTPENLPKLAFLKKMCPKIWTIGNRKKIFTYFIQKFLMFHMCIFLFRKWSIFVRVYIPLRVNQQGLKSFIGRNNYPEPLIFGFTNTPPPPVQFGTIKEVESLGWLDFGLAGIQMPKLSTKNFFVFESPSWFY